MKVCSTCKECKPSDEFPTHKRRGRTELRPHCKQCRSEYQRKYRAQNAAKTKAGARAWHLQAKYGLNEIEFGGMLFLQDNKCAICGRPDPTNVDHDHKTGKVRGILCGPCNRAIGLLGDDRKTVEAAARYLAVEAHASNV